MLAVTGAAAAGTLATGHHHSVVVDGSGSVWASGRNASAQLGNGLTTSSSLPVAVSGLTGIIAVAAGKSHTLALGLDDRVWAWGDNAYGHLGDGTAKLRVAPVRVAGISAVVGIAAGAWHSAAVESDGRPWVWGSGSRGELGRGSSAHALIPVRPASGPAGLLEIAASGGQHTAALGADGTIWGWGANGYGQIGDGTTLDRYTPVKVSEAGYAWKVGTPVFSVVPGEYMTTQSVALSTATPGATIRYTADGTDPTPDSPLYAASIPVTATTTIKARAFKAGLPDSNVGVGLTRSGSRRRPCPRGAAPTARRRR
jgi:alpha-tubulin suppressor-like RCC1 family protein